MKTVKDFLNELETTRDELKVQSHLLKSEVKEKWDGLESKWEKINNEVAPTKEATKEAIDNISEANKLLLTELKEGYKKIKDTL
ncbi:MULTISPECIES: hypothetical protein [Halobacteriovorax]|uniref:Uncharacterized protein n=1 Tax=Halobacteriovorax vibrionivorans TaxID=2152716 RepID=A0ABY0IJE2_9BACT|nr:MULTISPECIES: hypothetical protein [Halobacteriovorax]AYF43798.1 hypothetical protein BALOs_0788 [Halobacteriovorax sp. BALOs_7]RZF21669.1 hypothetical protein DAY19_08245 [Halobacteriovorax vibrionivorans]TGD49039.1 hypothetical protein EP118_00800 [Halobacteriovorax sp. Y22]